MLALDRSFLQCFERSPNRCVAPLFRWPAGSLLYSALAARPLRALFATTPNDSASAMHSMER